MQIPTDPAGVAWHGGEAGDASEPVDVLKRVEAAADLRDECGRENGPEPGQGGQKLRAVVARDVYGDIRVDTGEVL